jgi:hypothetical protein
MMRNPNQEDITIINVVTMRGNNIITRQMIATQIINNITIRVMGHSKRAMMNLEISKTCTHIDNPIFSNQPNKGKVSHNNT